jgi:hypothetical protein
VVGVSCSVARVAFALWYYSMGRNENPNITTLNVLTCIIYPIATFVSAGSEHHDIESMTQK